MLVAGEGAKRRRVWVKGDPLPPGQRQSPVRDASPLPPPLCVCVGGALDSVVLAESTKKDPAKLWVGGQTVGVPILGSLLFLPCPLPTMEPTMEDQNSSLFKTKPNQTKPYRAERAGPRVYLAEDLCCPTPEAVCVHFTLSFAPRVPSLFLNTQTTNRGCRWGADSHLWSLPCVSQEGLGLPHHGGQEGQGAMRSLF